MTVARTPSLRRCRPGLSIHGGPSRQRMRGGRRFGRLAVVVQDVRGEGGRRSSDRAQPPRVLRLAWGRMEVDTLGVGKDFKLYPGGGRTWDWSETATWHVPGIQPADVEELLDHGATTVVLSRGMDERLHVDPRTLELLDARSVVVHVAETRAAVKLYNELVGHVPVGGLFHSTC